MSESSTPIRSWPASRTGIILLLVAGFVAALLQLRDYEVQRSRTVREQADILAASVPAALAFHDVRAADEYVRPMRVNPEIDGAGIYASDGDLMAGYVRENSEPLPARIPPDGGTLRIGVVSPVVQQGTPLGWVYVRPSPEPLLHQLERYVGLAILAAMALIVVVNLGKAHRELTRQSQRLAEANERLKREMTERAQAEEALRQGQKMEAVGQLAGGIAHDLNNHLAIIRGNLGLLQQKLGFRSDDRHYVRSIEGVDRAANLTRRVLSFSRKQPVAPIKLDMNELITGMADLIHSSLRSNIDVEYDLRSSAFVLADRNQVENVILNLLVNARDAMPEGGNVMIGTEDVLVSEGRLSAFGAAPGPYVLFSIQDTGIGMTAEVRERARDPFFTTKPFGEGTGLGLSLAASFAAQSGGMLKIESEPQKGTIVSLLLPKHAEADHKRIM